MADKCLAQLPCLRVPERLEHALMRLAAGQNRALSDYVRLVLERHAFGHAPSVYRDGDSRAHSNAAHADARNHGGGAP